MDVIIFIGRIVFSMILIGSGIGHFADTKSTAATAASRGLPNPELMARISGAALFAGGVGIVLGIWADLAFLGVGLLVLIIAFTMHPFWKDEGEKQVIEMSMFMKNLNIAGSCLIAFGFIAGAQYSEIMITEPLFDIS